jgi:hypothetical protein
MKLMENGEYGKSFSLRFVDIIHGKDMHPLYGILYVTQLVVPSRFVFYHTILNFVFFFFCLFVFLADVYHEKKDVFEREAGQCITLCLCSIFIMYYRCIHTFTFMFSDMSYFVVMMYYAA